MTRLEVLFTPAEFAALEGRVMTDTACAVVDALRATSSMVAALANGARAVRPVATIEAALQERARDPECLLAGERNGLRIAGEVSGGVEFDLGNSPREFTRDRVSGRRIVMTTTNGTRALRACAGAGRVFAAAFVNLAAAAEALRTSGAARWLVVCSGTGEEASYEDTLVAGALCEALGDDAALTDSGRVALSAWRGASARPEAEFASSFNARRLLAIPGLADDVAWCARRSVFPIAPELRDGLELT